MLSQVQNGINCEIVAINNKESIKFLTIIQNNSNVAVNRIAEGDESYKIILTHPELSLLDAFTLCEDFGYVKKIWKSESEAHVFFAAEEAAQKATAKLDGFLYKGSRISCVTCVDEQVALNQQCVVEILNMPHNYSFEDFRQYV